jgi:PAS domain S-box-containing protein
VRHSSDITSITDRRGQLTYVSPALHRTLGLDGAEVLGRSTTDFLHPDDLRELRPRLSHLLATTGATLAYQVRFAHGDGSWRWLDVIATNLLGEPGIDGIVANARDVTETRELHEQLRHQVDHDPLTGLANRRLFAERMRAAEHSRAAVLLIDGRTIAVRASVGMVVGAADDNLIHAADLKMYEAKRLRAARREA